MNRTIQQLLVVISTANVAFEKKFFDIVVGPIDQSKKGNSFILTIQDDLSKFSTADHTANMVAKAFVENVICHHGIPKAISSNRPRSRFHEQNIYCLL